jgi:hypothetical protein
LKNGAAYKFWSENDCLRMAPGALTGADHEVESSLIIRNLVSGSGGDAEAAIPRLSMWVSADPSLQPEAFEYATELITVRSSPVIRT